MSEVHAPSPPIRSETPARPASEWLPTAPGVTHVAPHVRDALDVRRALGCVLLAVLPCALVGVVNAGHQALLVAGDRGPTAPSGWRGDLLGVLGLAPEPESTAACAVYGLACALPMLAVALGVSRAWQQLFARVRGRVPSEAVPVVAVLFTLVLPPGIPLWQVALGITFATVVGLEIFGGTGRNVVNPALAGLAFLYFAYPASFSSEGAWVALEGPGTPTVLAAAAQGGLDAVQALGVTWRGTLLGWEPGALGETSALACALGAAFLVYARVASWRVIAGGLLGLVVSAALARALGDAERPLVSFPWHWHLTAGSFAFGLAFLATDPVTSAATAVGRWLYGGLIGALVVLVRVFNPAHAEGVMLAILLANVSAPLIDHLVVHVHVRRRRRRLD